MKIVGVIPARYSSSRFPGKPLIDLKGKSMIQRVYEGVSKSTVLSEVIVATDDQRIFDEVKRFGGKVQLTSTEHTTGTDRCGEVAKAIDADVVINIQGDEPLVDFEQIEQLAKAFSDPEVKIASLGIKTTDPDDLTNPNRIKIVLDAKKNALYFSRSPIPNTKNASKSIVDNFHYLRHIGVYAYRNETLQQLVQLKPTVLEQIESLEQLRWLYHGFSVRIVETDIETPNIDVPSDVEKVLAHL